MQLTEKELDAWRAYAVAAIGAPWFFDTLGALRHAKPDAELWTLASMVADSMVHEERERTKPESVPPKAPWAEPVDMLARSLAEVP